MDIFDNAYSASLLDRGKRYILREFLGGTAIKDTATDKLYGYGKGCSGFEPGDEYRVLYTKADAEAVCFMLNERDVWAKAHAGDYTLDMIRQRHDR